MVKSRKVNSRKNTTLFQKKKYKIDGIGTQHYLKLLGFSIIIGVSDESFYIRFDSGVGVSIDSKPKFSIRHGKVKSLKIGKYYITKLKKYDKN